MQTYDYTIDYNEQMLNYYPEVIKDIREFQALIKSQSMQVEQMHYYLIRMLENAYVSTADSDTLSKWEQFLSITPLPQGDDDYEIWIKNRRKTILARLYKVEKLNSDTISDIVKIFTGGTAESWFLESTLYVKIYPPENNELFNLDDVITALKAKCPAHLNLVVYKDYITWKQIYDSYTWEDVYNNFNTWGELVVGNPDVEVFEYIVDEDGGYITDETSNLLFN